MRGIVVPAREKALEEGEGIPGRTMAGLVAHLRIESRPSTDVHVESVLA